MEAEVEAAVEVAAEEVASAARKGSGIRGGGAHGGGRAARKTNSGLKVQSNKS